MPHALPPFLDTYFRTFEAGDEKGHLALCHPHVTYFGSGTGDSEGTVAILGIFRIMRERLHLARIKPRQVFGQEPELAVLVDMFVNGQEAPILQGVFAFRLDDQGLIRRLSILYDPLDLARLLPG